MSALHPDLVGRLDVTLVRELDAALVERSPESARVQNLIRQDGSSLELRLHSQPSRVVIPWIHGGGMMLGSAAYDDACCRDLSETLGVCVASVDHRLAPEHPHPEPLEDCFTALAPLTRDRPGYLGGTDADASAAPGRADDTGGVHAFEVIVPDTDLSRAVIARRRAALVRMIAGEPTKGSTAP